MYDERSTPSDQASELANRRIYGPHHAASHAVTMAVKLALRAANKRGRFTFPVVHVPIEASTKGPRRP